MFFKRYKITFPVECGNSFDLPERCIITGTTDDVFWKKHTFYYIPAWTFLGIIFCMVPFIIFIAFFQQQTTLEIPITPKAWFRWQLSHRLLKISLFISSGLFCGAYGSYFKDSVTVTVLCISAGLVLLVASLLFYAKNGLRASRITETQITFRLPNEATVAPLKKLFPQTPPT